MKFNLETSLITTGGMGCLGKSSSTSQYFDKLIERFENHCIIEKYWGFIAFDNKTINKLSSQYVNGNGILFIGIFKNNRYKSGNDNLPFHSLIERKKFIIYTITQLQQNQLYPVVVLNEGYFNMQSFSWYDLEKNWCETNITKMLVNIGYYNNFDEFNEWQSTHRPKSKINSENISKKQMQSRLKTFENHNMKFQRIFEYFKDKQNENFIIQKIPFTQNENFIETSVCKILNFNLIKGN